MWHSSNLMHFKLLPNEVDLWAFSLLRNSKKIDELLTLEELERANRFIFPHHQRRFKVARATLKTILANYLKKKVKDVDFTYNAYGKPILSPFVSLEFNLTHSDDFALLAVTRDEALGVDLELFSARPYDGLAQHTFAKKEVDMYQRYPAFFKPMIFFHIWTQKEALMKATGLGFHYPTQAFEVPIALAEKSIVDDPKHQRQWQMISFMPKIASCAALCCSLTIRKVNYSEIDPLTLF